MRGATERGRDSVDPGSARTARSEGSRPLPDLERTLGRIVAVFNLLNAPAAFTNFKSFAASTTVLEAVVLLLLLAAPVLVDVVAAATGRAGRLLWAGSAVLSLLAVLLWPVLVVSPESLSQPGWVLAMLIPVMLQTLMATRSARTTALVAAGVLACVLVAALRADALPPLAVLAHALLSTPYGIVLATVITVVRHAAASTAKAQRTSLTRIASARFEDITEEERVRTDALVHDTVLTTLLQASSALDDDETARAERMARNALRVLGHVRRTRDLGAGVRLGTVLTAEDHELHALLPEFRVLLEDDRLEDLLLPADAATALLTATAEAMANTVRHAGAQQRVLRLSPLGPDGVRIEVDDDGCGFDYPTGAGAGIRDRIVTPVMLVEGRSEISSGAGRGTSVRLNWGSVSLADVRPIESRLREAGA